jgi:hypothetical protein
VIAYICDHKTAQALKLSRFVRIEVGVRASIDGIVVSQFWLGQLIGSINHYQQAKMNAKLLAAILTTWCVTFCHAAGHKLDEPMVNVRLHEGNNLGDLMQTKHAK